MNVPRHDAQVRHDTPKRLCLQSLSLLIKEFLHLSVKHITPKL
jgi:hypothetical protein